VWEENPPPVTNTLNDITGKEDPLMEPLVHVTRGELIECIHYGDIAVCDYEGRLVGAVGDPGRTIYWRSAAKPIQALAVVQSGAADKFEFTAKELSICCASHCGSADHVATVRGILAKIGLDESVLQCGTHWPGDTDERNRLIRAGQQPLPVHNNCSGKHSGKLATTVTLGADPAEYLQIESPVQQAILGNMSALSGVPREEIIISVDGCTAPIHGMPLQAMATAYARLSRPEGMPEEIQQAAPRIIAAMAAQPVMVSGKGSFNTELLAAYQGRVVAKGGAEGLFVLGLTDIGIGVAVRTTDGSSRGQSSVVLRVLEQLGMVDDTVRAALARHFSPAVTNCRNEPIGEIRSAEFIVDL